jgi:hypothetical protein
MVKKNIKRRPIVYNDVTRRTELAISSGRYTRRLLDGNINSTKAKAEAFRLTINYVLGDGWFDLDKLGRLRRERR